MGRESWHLRKQRYFPCFHPKGLSRSHFPWSWEVCRGKTLSEENESERWRQTSFLPGAAWSFPPHKRAEIAVLSPPPPLKQRTEPTAPQPTSTQVLQFCSHNRVQALMLIAERPQPETLQLQAPHTGPRPQTVYQQGAVTEEGEVIVLRGKEGTTSVGKCMCGGAEGAIHRRGRCMDNRRERAVYSLALICSGSTEAFCTVLGIKSRPSP